MQFVMSHLHHLKMQGVFVKSLGICSSKKQIPTHSIKFILTSKCGAIQSTMAYQEVKDNIWRETASIWTWAHCVSRNTCTTREAA